MLKEKPKPAQKKEGRLKCRKCPHRPRQVTLRRHLRDWKASRAGKARWSPEGNVGL